MKYFRSYPYMLQLLLLLLMVFTFYSAAQILMFFIVNKAGSVTAQQIANIGPDSPASVINVAAIVAGTGNVFIFCVPALLFAYLATPRPAAYLGLRLPGKKINLLLAGLIMLGAIPVLEALGGLIGQINFGAGVKASQKENDDMFAAFMNIATFPAFLKIFILTAIIPPVGEELFFRGLLLRFAARRSTSMVFPVLFTAAVFAGVHANIYGALSIVLAGVLLAVIYYLTGSLWCSIIGHLVFNGSQILLSYAGHNNATVKAFTDSGSTAYYLFAGGLILSCGAFYLLWKNRSPLPANWTDDFTAAEIKAA